MKCVAIIPSGGIGSRFNSPIPKQYIKVLGKELIVYTLEIFQNCTLIDEIIIPASEPYFELLNHIKEKYSLTKISEIVEGGKERQNSVYNGLNSKMFDNDDLIVVHDAARPLLTNTILENGIKNAIKFDSAVVAIKARDTLLESDNDKRTYLNRSNIYSVQTPQIFKYGILSKSFEYAEKNNIIATDESSLVHKANYEISLVEGDLRNFKITSESDLEVFEKLIK